MKIRKFILAATSLLSAGAFAAVSCGTSNVAEKGEIIVAVDGVQKDFYQKAIEIYNKTPSAANFKIKTLQKDVWGALDFGLQGNSSSEVADIFYLPGDRVTDLTQKNALSYIDDLIPELIDELAQATNATEAEKAQLRSFGTIRGRSGNNSVSKLMAIRHNTEAIILASRLPEAEARTVLTNPNTDTLLELINQGKLLLRFQDFWYANGVLAGAFEKLAKDNPNDATLTNIMSRILYTDTATGKISSGFVEGNQYNAHFKAALKVYSSLFFPIYEAAFLKDSNAYAETVWGKNGISQSDLVESLNSSTGEAQAKIFSLMKDGKIDYAVIGSWDTQNSETAGGAKSFFNVVKADDNNRYLQTPGSWSFAINSRNNGASSARKTAIKEFFKALYSVEAFTEYFKDDSKIPFVDNVQKTLINGIKSENTAEFNEVTKFAQELGYANYAALKADVDKKISDISVLSSQGIWGNSWSADGEGSNKTDHTADANKLKAASQKSLLKRPEGVSQSDFDAITLGDILPLRNTVAALLSVDNLDNLVGEESAGSGKQTWMVGKDLLKEGSLSSDDAAKMTQSPIALHMRKIENYIFGVNGDNDTNKFIQELTTALTTDKQNNNTVELDKIVNEKIANAKKFVTNFAKTTLDDAKIKEVVKLYLNTYLNAARVRASVGDIFKNTVFVQGKTATYKEVDEKVKSYESKLTIDKLLSVISSDKEIAQGGLGKLETQPARVDNSNPQFGIVWDYMNNRTFGNAQLYREMASEGINTLDAFTNKMAKTLSGLFSNQIGVLNTSNSTTYVTISN